MQHEPLEIGELSDIERRAPPSATEGGKESREVMKVGSVLPGVVTKSRQLKERLNKSPAANVFDYRIERAVNIGL